MLSRIPVVMLLLVTTASATNIFSDMDDFAIRINSQRQDKSSDSRSGRGSNCQGLVAENQRLRSQIQAVRSSLVGLKNVTRRAEQFKQENEELQKKLDIVRNENNAIAKENISLRGKLDELTKASEGFDKLKGENLQLKSQVAGLQKVVDELSINSGSSGSGDNDQQIKNLKAKVGSLEVEIQSQKQMNSACESDNKALQKKVDESTVELNNFRKVNHDLASRFGNCQDQLAKSSSTINDQRGQIATLSGENQSLRDENASLLGRSNNCENESQRANLCQANLAKCTDEAKGLSSKLLNAQSDLEKSAGEIKLCLEDVKTSKIKSDDFEKQIGGLRENNQKLFDDWQAQIKLSQKAQDELLKQTDKSEKCQREFTDINDRLKAFSEQLLQNNNTIKELENSLKKKEAIIQEYSDKNNKCQKLQTENETFQITIQNLRVEMSQKETRVEEIKTFLNNCKTETENLQIKVAGISSDSETNKKQVAQCQHDLDKLKTNFDSLFKNNQVLTVENASLKEQIQQPDLSRKQLENKIMELEKLLSDSKYGFSELEKCRATLKLSAFDIESCANKNTSLEKQFFIQKAAADECSLNFNLLKSKNSEFEGKFQIFLEENRNLKSNFESLQLRFNALNQNANNLKSQNENLSSQLGDCHEKRSKLETDFTNLNIKTLEFEAQIQNLKSGQLDCADSRSKLNELRQNFEMCQFNLDQLKKDKMENFTFIKKLTDEIAELKGSVNRMNVERAEWTKDRQALLEKSDACENRAVGLTRELSSVRIQINNLTTKIKDLEFNLQLMTSKHVQCSKSYQELDAEITNIRINLNNCSNDLNKRNFSFSELERHIDSLKKELQSKGDVQKLNEQFAKELEALKNSLISLKGDLEAEDRERSKNINQLGMLITKLTNGDTYGNLINKLRLSTKQIEIINQLIVFIDSSVSSLITDKNALEVSKKACDVRVADLTNQLQSSTAQRASLEVEKQSLERRLTDCQNERRQVESQTQKCSNDLFIVNEQLNIAKKNLSEQQTLYQKCSGDYNSLQISFASLNGNYNNCVIENRNYISRIDDLSKARDSLSADLKNCNERHSNSNSQNTDLSSRLNQCNNDLSKLKNDFSSLQDESKKCAVVFKELSNNNEKLNVQFNNLSNENKNLNSQVAGIRGQFDSCNKSIIECNANRDWLNKINRDLRFNLDALNARFNSIQTDFESFKRSCQRISDENGSLKSRVTELQTSVDNLKVLATQGDACKIEFNNCKNQVGDLTKEVTRINNLNGSQSESISKLTNTLNELKISFNNLSNDREKCLTENNLLKQRGDKLGQDLTSALNANSDLAKQRDNFAEQSQKCVSQTNGLNLQIAQLTFELNEKNKLASLLQECNANNASCRAEVNSLKSKISDYEVTNQNLMKNLNSKDAQIDTCKAEVNRVNNELLKLTRLLSAEKTSGEDCGRKLADANRGLEKASIDTQRLTALLENARSEISKLSDLYSTAQNTIRECQKTQADLIVTRKDLETCTANNTKIEASRKLLEIDLANKTQQLALLRESLDKLRADLDKIKTEQLNFFSSNSSTKRQLMTKIAELEADKSKQASQINSLLDENANYRIQVTKLSTQLSICDDISKRLAEMTAANNENITRLNQLRISYGELEGTIKQRNQQISQIEVRLTQLNDLNNQLQNERERLNRELLSVSSEIGALKLQRDSLRSANTDLTDQVNSLSSRVRNYETQFTECNNSRQNLQQRVATLEEADRACQQVRKEIKDLQSLAENLRNNLADCNRFKTQAENSLSDCRGNVNDLSIRLNNCQTDKDKTVANFRLDIDKLQLEIKNTNNASSECRDKEGKCRNDLAFCNSSNNNFVQEIKKLTLRIDECKTSDDRVNACRIELQNERTASQNKDKQITDLKVQVDDLRGSSQACQTQLRDTQAGIRRLESDNSQLLIQIASIRNDLTSCQSSRKEDLVHWTSQIQSLKGQLDDSDKKLSICRTDFSSLQKNFQLLTIDLESCKENVRISNEKITRLEKTAGLFEKCQADYEKSLTLITNLQKENSELSQLRNLHRECQAQITSITQSFTSRLNTCQRERHVLQNNFNTIADKILSLESQLKLANEKIVLLNTNNQALNEEKRNLLYKLSQCEFSLKELESRAGMFNTCNSELTRLKDQLRSAQNDRESLNREKSQLETKLQSTTSQLNQLTTKFKYLITKLEMMNVVKRERVHNGSQVISNSKDIDLVNSVYVGSSAFNDLD
jgi:chromosome segregation ATPase